MTLSGLQHYACSDYPEYRGRPATPPRYPPDYGRVGNTSPAIRYRLVFSGNARMLLTPC